MLRLLTACFGLAALLSAAEARGEASLAALGVIEVVLTSEQDYANPFWDVSVTIEATAPSGARQSCEAFWDGGRTWRARLRGDESGTWRWTSRVTGETDSGLSTTGEAQHGDAQPPQIIRVAASGTHLETADGEPFFWLADTAWNGALRSQPDDWQSYLDKRREQRFTAIQFVTTQWRGGDRVIPRHQFTGTERITIDPAAFAELDAKVAAIVERGLRPAPVMLWTLTPTDPGQALSEADAIRLARYEVARWGALAPAWLVGGDGCYLDIGVDRWKRIGRAVFGDCPEQLATLHPCGLSWIAEAFAGEDWLDFIGYQSGHGDGEGDLKWLVQGPPANSAKVGKPVINLEPNYEKHPAYQSGQLHTAANVRRASYWSMLVHAPAGVTYGNNEIWVWNEQTADAENHGNLRQIPPWRRGVETDGIADMTRLRTFFESGPWTELRPAQHLLAGQPGAGDPRRFTAVAKTSDDKWTVAYLPRGGTIKFTRELGDNGAQWFDPRTGDYTTAKRTEERAFEAPDDRDWILEFRD
jgi:hypothetical protein